MKIENVKALVQHVVSTHEAPESAAGEIVKGLAEGLRMAGAQRWGVMTKSSNEQYPLVLMSEHDTAADAASACSNLTRESGYPEGTYFVERIMDVLNMSGYHPKPGEFVRRAVTADDMLSAIARRFIVS